MTLYCSVSSSAPATTNVIMGYYDNKNYYLDLTAATVEQNQIITDFLSVTGMHVSIEIDDVPGSVIFEGTIIIPEEADLDLVTINYINLTQSEKNKVNSYVSLIASLVVE